MTVPRSVGCVAFLLLQALCAKGALILNMKSTSVEEAVNELISMLFFHHEPEERADVPAPEPAEPEDEEDPKRLDGKVRRNYLCMCVTCICVCVCVRAHTRMRVCVYVNVCEFSRQTKDEYL